MDGDGYYDVKDTWIYLTGEEIARIAGEFMELPGGRLKAITEEDERKAITKSIELYFAIAKDKGIFDPKHCWDYARTVAVFIKLLSDIGCLRFHQLFGYATTASLGHHVAVAIKDNVSSGKGANELSDIHVLDTWVTAYGEQILMEAMPLWKSHFKFSALYREPTASKFYSDFEYCSVDQSAITNASYVDSWTFDTPTAYSPVYQRVAMKFYFPDRYKASDWEPAFHGSGKDPAKPRAKHTVAEVIAEAIEIITLGEVDTGVFGQ